MIDSFSCDYAFLSNFFPSPICIDGLVYPTVEHAFQAAKVKDREIKKQFTQIRKPAGAKSLGRKVSLRHDWEHVKVSIMTDLVRLKFQDPELAQRLLDTGDQRLVEGNHWNDRFWGVCSGYGRNELGKILMKIRDELRVASGLEPVFSQEANESSKPKKKLKRNRSNDHQEELAF